MDAPPAQDSAGKGDDLTRVGVVEERCARLQPFQQKRSEDRVRIEQAHGAGAVPEGERVALVARLVVDVADLEHRARLVCALYGRDEADAATLERRAHRRERPPLAELADDPRQLCEPRTAGLAVRVQVHPDDFRRDKQAAHRHGLM